jgi:hypothetical protein
MVSILRFFLIGRASGQTLIFVYEKTPMWRCKAGVLIMRKTQALWTLSGGEALSLPIGPGARELSVTQGRLWLTQVGSVQALAQDIWLEAGQTIELAAGSQVVLEPWPSAQFQLLVPPSACKEIRRRVAAKSGLMPSWAKPSSAITPA